METYLPVLVATLLIVSVWYILGTVLSRRRVTRWAYLIAALLSPLGEEESFRWLGSSAAEFRLTSLRRPFISLVAVIWILPPWYAPARLLARARGQQTILGVAAELGISPLAEFVLADPSVRVGQRALAQAATRGWHRQEIQFVGRPFALASPDEHVAQRVIRSLERSQKQMPSEMLRLVVQTGAPQVSISFRHPERLPSSRPSFPRWLQSVATTVTRG